MMLGHRGSALKVARLPKDLRIANVDFLGQSSCYTFKWLFRVQ